MSARTSCGLNDHVDVETGLIGLREKFQCTFHVAKGTNLVGAAAWYDVNDFTICVQLCGALLHLGGHVGATGKLCQTAAEKAAEKDVAICIVSRVCRSGSILK